MCEKSSRLILIQCSIGRQDSDSYQSAPKWLTYCSLPFCTNELRLAILDRWTTFRNLWWFYGIVICMIQRSTSKPQCDQKTFWTIWSSFLCPRFLILTMLMPLKWVTQPCGMIRLRQLYLWSSNFNFEFNLYIAPLLLLSHYQTEELYYKIYIQ